MTRLGHPVSNRRYAAMGVRIGLPALVAALAVHLAVNALAWRSVEREPVADAGLGHDLHAGARVFRQLLAQLVDVDAKLAMRSGAGRPQTPTVRWVRTLPTFAPAACRA